MTISTKELVTSLASECCPACAKKKRQSWTFCADCYYALTTREQKNLYNRVGAAYGEAVIAAMRRRRRTEFIVRADPKPRNAPDRTGAQMTLFSGGRTGIQR